MQTFVLNIFYMRGESSSEARIAKARRKARGAEGSGARNVMESSGRKIIVGTPDAAASEALTALQSREEQLGTAGASTEDTGPIEALQTREEEFGTVRTKSEEVRPIEGLQTRAESLGTTSKTEEDEFGGEDTEISKTIVREPTPKMIKIVKGTPERPPSAEAVIKKADDAEIQRILSNIKEFPDELLDA